MGIKGTGPEGQQAAGLEETDSGMHLLPFFGFWNFMAIECLPKANCILRVLLCHMELEEGADRSSQEPAMEGMGGISGLKKEKKKERETLKVCLWIEDPWSNLGPGKWS